MAKPSATPSAIIFASAHLQDYADSKDASRSIRRQVVNCRARANDLNLPVKAIYTEDIALSVTPLAERPILLSALNDLSPGDHLIALDWYRLSRKIADSINIAALVIEKRAEVNLIIETHESSGEIQEAVGRVVFALMGLLQGEGRAQPVQ